ncbi:MAG: GNAT family N-acetyltransferase [Ruminococcaceae bacterium]|nr:GNAT family N-acetyltransferase [Oscillospiraceae bacterium]
MIIREDSTFEKMVVEEEYHIAVPVQITQYADGHTDYLVYSFCENTAAAHAEKFTDPFAEPAVTWLADVLQPTMEELGYETIEKQFHIHREYRITALPEETELAGRVELLSELTEEDVENGMEALSEFELDPDNPDDRMTVIRENGSIIAFAAVNDMQEDAVIEITVECDPAYRRKGYGRACVIALTKYFMNRGLEVKYLCDEDNEASMATAESAGFTLYSRVLPMVYYRREEDEE